MKNSLLLSTALAVATSIFGIFLPAPQFTKKELAATGEVFQVVVVGKLDDKDPDAKVGVDVWNGAQAVSEGQNFELVHVDDNDEPGAAKVAADKLAADPRVLAVVGHSISATTRAAIGAYSEAGIPFVIPVATAQSAVYAINPRSADDQSLGDRLDNAFRLRPSDDRAQAPAISFLVSRLSDYYGPSLFKVHLIISTEKNTAVYSKPLGAQIRKILKKSGYVPDNPNNEEISLSNLDQISTEISVEHDRNGVVIFCGYAGEANKFLRALQLAYSNAKKEPPSFIFTEAATDIEKNFPSLPVYRTVPDDIGRCRLSEKLRKTAHSSEFVSGYDAVELLSIVAHRCKQKNKLSRQCVLSELRATPAFPGACRGYSFRDGESVLSNYFVFSSTAAPDLELHDAAGVGRSFEVSAGNIIQLEAGASEIIQ